jgi:hypothetical protein
MNSRRHPKRRTTGKHFAQIPVEVLTSDACRSLPNYAIRVLIAIAAQYRGNNNGDLAMTRATARGFGVDSQEHLVRSLAALLERHLIEKTRQGGKKPFGPTLYAITWQPIDDLGGKIESGATTTPTNAWATWSLGLPADQSAKSHRVCRRTTLGLPADQSKAKSGLAADHKVPFIGSAGSPPSRFGSGARSSSVVDGSDAVSPPTGGAAEVRPAADAEEPHRSRAELPVSLEQARSLR